MVVWLYSTKFLQLQCVQHQVFGVMGSILTVPLEVVYGLHFLHKVVKGEPALIMVTLIQGANSRKPRYLDENIINNLENPHGSRRDAEVGFRIKGPNFWAFKFLGSSPTFQAEMLAINLCTWINSSRKPKVEIYILSESQAALTSLNSCNFVGQVFCDCNIT
ncbi:hypothetical protein J6590_064520 [Homalodisca vitripennis]|nr:hypothetical protein J6590_064520 [Homalodisca vitripennis]